MPVAKLSASGVPNAMKSDEGNDSLDTFIRQAIGKEPLLSFSRTGDNPVQWIQLLHALDQQDIPGWPLMTPMKVQMQKCEKCSREFCSPINYRRHIRMHRRSLNVDKESHKNRDLLGAFWDKLSLEEAKEVVSFDNVSLKEVSGSSVVKALASSLRKPGVWTLPQVYVKAGSILLDIIQAKSSRLPISSQELFSILDDASERTFLCAGTAESVQRYVIVGEAEKALELKNLVACASLLFEQNLVKAWLADKDVEALRCQKLLVEEEEAAQKRLAQLLEKKKQKKLRQKEQKEREQLNGEKTDTSADNVEGPDSAEMSIPLDPADSNSNDARTLADITTCLEQIQLSREEYDEDVEAQFGFGSDYLDMDPVQNVETLVELANGCREFDRWQVPKSHRIERNGFHCNQHLHALKLKPVPKQGSPKERSALVNGCKVWTRKSRVENNEDGSRPKLQKVTTNQMDKSNCALMIGSITVPVRNCTGQQEDNSQGALCDSHAELAIPKKNNISEKILKSEAVSCARNQAVAKVWRPVSQSDTTGPLPAQRGNHHDSEEGAKLGKVEDRTTSSEICLHLCAADADDTNSRNDCLPLSQGNEKPESLCFSSTAVKAFLTQRWKEAISADHMKLILSLEPESAGHPNYQNGGPALAPSDFCECCILGDEENRPTGGPVSSSNGNPKAKLRTKPEKGATKIKYIPKQKNRDLGIQQ